MRTLLIHRSSDDERRDFFFVMEHHSIVSTTKWNDKRACDVWNPNDDFVSNDVSIFRVISTSSTCTNRFQQDTRRFCVWGERKTASENRFFFFITHGNVRNLSFGCAKRQKSDNIKTVNHVWQKVRRKRTGKTLKWVRWKGLKMLIEKKVKMNWKQSNERRRFFMASKRRRKEKNWVNFYVSLSLAIWTAMTFDTPPTAKAETAKSELWKNETLTMFASKQLKERIIRSLLCRCVEIKFKMRSHTVCASHAKK